MRTKLFLISLNVNSESDFGEKATEEMLKAAAKEINLYKRNIFLHLMEILPGTEIHKVIDQEFLAEVFRATALSSDEKTPSPFRQINNAYNEKWGNK